ncbi:APC family permease [Nocardiopsis protaetiae]|uniref:APC family permease n=1 Tax=Nocardiopsis protaetiae TaxID=3382270 RepID=UPI00387A9B11
MSLPPPAGPTDTRTADTADPAPPRGRLGTHHLVLLIVAAAAPLGVAIGNLPAGLILGNGIGLPTAFLAAAAVVACMATGFVRLAREVPAEGGFADLARAGLGPGAGLGVAYLTGLAYWTGSLALAAALGYFAGLIGTAYGVGLPWWAYSFAGFALVLLLGRRAADLSARMLLVLVAAEIGAVLLLDAAIIVNHGWNAFPLDVFSPENALSGNLGPAVLVGFTSFIGVESAILYTREARDPARSVPRATYTAVAAAGLLYVLTAWLVIGALGTGEAVAAAAEAEGDLVFGLALGEVGDTFLVLTQVFFVTSLLACFVALHNAGARYVQTLASRSALPRRLGRLHPRYLAPTTASTVLAVVGAALFLAFAVAGADPYIGLATSLTGLFTLGIVAAQAIVSIAVVVHFRRRRAPLAWSTLVAPVLGGGGAVLASVAIVANYPVLTGSDSAAARALPIVLLAAVAAGFAVHAFTASRPGSPPGAPGTEEEGDPHP